MGQIPVRKLDDRIVERLKRQAKSQGVSLEEAVRRILADAVRPNKAELLREIDRIRSTSKPINDPPFGWQMIREDRDRR